MNAGKGENVTRPSRDREGAVGASWWYRFLTVAAPIEDVHGSAGLKV
jgi:hypothetical protein